MKVTEKKAVILCAICGNKFTPDKNNICDACVLASFEDKKVLDNHTEVNFCRACYRYEDAYQLKWLNC